MEKQGLMERVKVDIKTSSGQEYGGLAHNGIGGAFSQDV
jgi:hypothetical protein